MIDPAKDAAYAARQFDHRRCGAGAGSGRCRNREISRRPIFFVIAPASRSGSASVRRKAWDPILDWARNVLGADFTVGDGVVHVRQPQAALAAAARHIPSDPWRLGALHSATTLTGSALIGLALLSGRLSADAAWEAAHVDEDWNMEQWGSDEIALARRAARFAELQAAAAALAGLSIPAMPENALAAGDAHMPRQRRRAVTAINDEIVALRLAADRFVDRGVQNSSVRDARSGLRRSAASF